MSSVIPVTLAYESVTSDMQLAERTVQRGDKFEAHYPDSSIHKQDIEACPWVSLRWEKFLVMAHRH